MTPSVVAIIPARYASTRLPGKPLISIGGKPLIQWVYENARNLQKVDRIIVATDHQAIAQAIRAIGGEALLTEGEFRNGTERVGWVAEKIDADIVVNLQGDEPLVSTTAVDAAIAFLQEHPERQVATLGCPLDHPMHWSNPNIVKVVVNREDDALYFSRSAIPFFRDEPFRGLKRVLRHIGIYVFRKKFLLEYVRMPVSELEEAEKLEQLRILEQGLPIRVIRASRCSPGVDTAEDIPVVEHHLRKTGMLDEK